MFERAFDKTIGPEGLGKKTSKMRLIATKTQARWD
jgi:hypothetical protein